jgi:hypothetical protein
LQNSSQSSISSSEEEELQRRANGGQQSKLQKLENEAKNVVGVMMPHRHQQEDGLTDGNTGPVVPDQSSREHEVVDDSPQRPKPGTLQDSGIGRAEAEQEKQDYSVHHSTTTTTTTTTTHFG